MVHWPIFRVDQYPGHVNVIFLVLMNSYCSIITETSKSVSHGYLYHYQRPYLALNYHCNIDGNSKLIFLD